MGKASRLDYSRLLGFDAVSDHLEDGVDFQNPTIGARLGAKVGTETTTATTTPEPTKSFMPMDDVVLDIGEPGEPVMRGSDGKDIKDR